MPLHEAPNPLQSEKGRVPFVHVIHGRLQTQRFQYAATADTQHHLLPDAQFAIAPVELVDQIPAPGLVCIEVSVQQVETDAPNCRFPDLSPYILFRVSYFHGHGEAIGSTSQFQRKVMEIIDNVAFLLPAGRIEVLREIALLIEEPDADQRHPKIAR